MQILASVALLSSLLSGCVGIYTTDAIESKYHSCLAEFNPQAGYAYAHWEAVCDIGRKGAYDYRLSARRFIPTYPGHGGGSGKGTTHVFIAY